MRQANGISILYIKQVRLEDKGVYRYILFSSLLFNTISKDAFMHRNYKILTSTKDSNLWSKANILYMSYKDHQDSEVDLVVNIYFFLELKITHQQLTLFL